MKGKDGMGTMTCECSDRGCSVHAGTGHCDGRDVVRLYRVDMRDDDGTLFCEACADDAMGSGLYCGEGDPDTLEPEAIDAFRARPGGAS